MNPIEKASFFDPNQHYGEEVVPDAILDLDVIDNKLIATLPNNQTKEFGRWTGPSPLQVESIDIQPDQTIHTIMNNGEKHITPQARFDLLNNVAIVGDGIHEESLSIANFSDERFDWFDESRGLMFAVAKDPKTVALSGLSVTTATGVVITGSSQWGSSYTVYKTLNRKVDSTQDGLGSAAGGLTITHNYPTPILFMGYGFKNLRTDYPSTSFRIEYSVDGTNWVIFDTRSTAGNVMGHYEKLIADPILVLKVRFVATNPGASSCGYFNVITAGWGIVEKFKSLNFHPDYFDHVENDTELRLIPKAINQTLSGTPFGLKNYIRAVVEANPNEIVCRPNSVANGDIFRFNKIEFTSIPLKDTLPVLTLPAGKYYYRFSVVDTTRGKGAVFIAPGSAPYSLGKVHLFDVGVTTEVATRLLEGEGQFNISEEQEITLKLMMTGGTGAFGTIPTPQQNKSKLATLELWRIGDSVDEFAHPLAPPVAGMKCSSFLKLDSVLNSGSSLDLLFTSPITAGGAYWSVANHNVVVYVNKPFRLWRAADVNRWQGKLKITYFGNGAIDLSSRQLTLTGLENVWELATKDLPAGIYKFEYAGTARIDRAWYFETVDNPQYSDIIISNKILPMSSNTDQGQIAAASDSYSAAHQPFNVFGAINTLNGWASVDGTYPSTNPVTTPSWVEIDLGKIVTINSLAIYNRTVSDPNLSMKGFRFAGWNTTTESWDTILEVADRNMSAAGGVTKHEGLGDRTYRKFRIFALSRYAASAGALVTIGKIELYHTGENTAADNSLWL